MYEFDPFRKAYILFYFYSQAAISFLTIMHIYLLYFHAHVMKMSNWSALGYNEQKYTAPTAPYACTTLSKVPKQKSSAAGQSGQACRVILTLVPIMLRRAKTSNICDLWVVVIYVSC